MIRIKESIESKLKFSTVKGDWLDRMSTRIDVLGRKASDAFEEHDIKIVYGDEKADYGVSVHGNLVKGVPKHKCVLVKTEPPIYNLYYGWNLNNPKYMLKFLGVLSQYETNGFNPTLFLNFPTFYKQYHDKGRYVDASFDVPKDKLLCMMLRNKNTSYRLNSLFPILRKYNKNSNLPIKTSTDKKFCDIFGPEKYHSFGTGWDKRCYQFYIPRIPYFPNTFLKYNFLSQYKFNFCPENSRFKGYVSEKPLQAMICGSIPIYLGPPDVYEYLPEGTFIDFAQFDIDALCDYILNMSEREYNEYRKRIRKFITTKECSEFSSYIFAKKLINIIERDK